MKKFIVLGMLVLLQAACGVDTTGLADFGAAGRDGQLGRGAAPSLDGGLAPSSTGGAANGGHASEPSSTGGSVVLPASTGGSPAVPSASGGAVVPSSSGGSAVAPSSTGGSPAIPSPSGGAAAPASTGGSGGAEEQPTVVVMDGDVCANQADGTSCEGKISGDNEPSSGLHLGGLCHASVCCMGCWDGTACHYFDNSSCPAGPSGGGECFACDKPQTCRIMVQSGRPLPHMECL